MSRPVMFAVLVALGIPLLVGLTNTYQPAVAVAAVAERDSSDFPGISAQHDWPWWRGPTRNGISPSTKTPVRFSERENVVWRTTVPGRGHSSPIVVGERVFLATANTSDERQSVLAFDRRTGKQAWSHDLNQGGLPSRIHHNNTHASPTVACDGQRLFAVFHNHDTVQATALSLTGKQLWQKTVGPFKPQRFEYGYGPSPTLYRNSVIIAAEDFSGAYIAALDRTTGASLWRIARTSNTTYSTPIVAHVAGRDQLLISGADQVASYDPATGKSLWSTPGTSAATCGTMVWEGDVVFASGGYPKSETLAVRADGSGEVLWRNPQKCYEQSMLVHAGHVYALTDGGVLFCWRALDGKEMWKQRLRGPVSASPVLVGDTIYWANERGTMYVFKANPERLEMLAENQMGDESFASPAVADGKLFLRVSSSAGGTREESLYCIGE